MVCSNRWFITQFRLNSQTSVNCVKGDLYKDHLPTWTTDHTPLRILEWSLMKHIVVSDNCCQCWPKAYYELVLVFFCIIPDTNHWYSAGYSVSMCINAQSISSHIKMEVGVSIILRHNSHWAMTDFNMTFGSFRGLRAYVRWALSHVDTVIPWFCSFRCIIGLTL